MSSTVMCQEKKNPNWENIYEALKNFQREVTADILKLLFKSCINVKGLHSTKYQF